MKAVYIHTIDGYAAHFGHNQIVHQSYNEPTRAVATRRQIQREQAVSIAYRSASGYSLHEYGCRRIILPTPISKKQQPRKTKQS